MQEPEMRLIQRPTSQYEFSMLVGCSCRQKPMPVSIIYNRDNRYRLACAFERRFYSKVDDGGKQFFQVWLTWCTRCICPFANGVCTQDFDNFDSMLEIY